MLTLSNPLTTKACAENIWKNVRFRPKADTTLGWMMEGKAVNWAPMTPIVVSLTTSVFMALGAREHHQKMGRVAVYKFPSVYLYLFPFASVFFASVPFWPGVTGDHDSALIAFGIFALLPLVAAYYFRKYRLVIEGSRVTVGVFRKRDFDLTDIAHSELQSGRGAELRLQLRDGTKINISGLVTDFDQMAQSIIGRRS